MAWKITTKTFAASESPYTYNTAGDFDDIVLQKAASGTTVGGSIDGTNSATITLTSADTPYTVNNYPKIIFTNGSGDTVTIAERVKDPS